MRLLVVAERRSLLDVSLPFLRANYGSFPQTEIVPVYAHPFGDLTNLLEGPDTPSPLDSFRFGRGFKWSDFPVIRDARYKQRDFGELPPSARAGDTLFDRDALAAAVPSGAAPVPFAASTSDFAVVLCEDHPSCIHSAKLALDHLRMQGAPFDHVDCYLTGDPSPASLKGVFAKAGDWATLDGKKWWPSAIKRHFEFNYRNNAFALLGRAFRDAKPHGSSDGRGLIGSRNALQLMFVLRDLQDGPRLTDASAIRLMENWKGTGRHPVERDAFGAFGSRAVIIEHLVSAGVVSRIDKELSVTDFGHRFLERLHPDCRDDDQGLRLRAWMKLPPADALPKVNRYIRTFFGKQKRRSETQG